MNYRAGNVKKFGFLKINFKNGVEKLWAILQKTSFFSLKTFFQWFWETFLYVVWLCSSYLRDCLNIVLYPGKKSGTYDTSNRLYGRKREKVCIFTLNMGLRSYGATLQKTSFSTQNFFFRKLLENFLFVAWPCLIYLKDAPNIVLYVNKKIGTVRHTNQKIFTKPLEKKTILTMFPLYHCRGQYMNWSSVSFRRSLIFLLFVI